MQFNDWKDIYKHYSTWIAIAIIALNVILTITTGIPVEWLSSISTILGVLIIVAKKIKQGLDTANIVIEDLEAGNIPDTEKPDE